MSFLLHVKQLPPGSHVSLPWTLLEDLRKCECGQSLVEKPNRIWGIRKDRSLETQVESESMDIAFYAHLLPWEYSCLQKLPGEGTGMETL